MLRLNTWALPYLAMADLSLVVLLLSCFVPSHYTFPQISITHKSSRPAKPIVHGSSSLNVMGEESSEQGILVYKDRQSSY